ncbi:nucleotide exchange factor GrpE [Tepidimicrobium xylanilyticum]|uniref:nucleotide exchange factor GrpE n=1 Tax=Tepidimicrobium xylanilyticum TaxID=1123352 RepID=UPI00264B42D1|nr:nucleotide exchange factor GrpE [Tepidimicrobium xylanilyticum]GMG96029.1 hypothetical protein EN5CB1_08550 [Tepidimicrobium xylanilyticum]
MKKKDVLNEEAVDMEEAAEKLEKEDTEEKLEKGNLEEGIATDEKEDEEADETEVELKQNNEVKELTNRLLRLQADFINYKNRVEREKERIFSYAAEEIISELLPVLDNFERALESTEEKDGFYEGIKMIYEQILTILKGKGLEEIDCLGKEFDPSYHHAVFVEEVEGEKEGTIIEVMQKGYILNDKVIRPSMVKVAK